MRVTQRFRNVPNFWREQDRSFKKWMQIHKRDEEEVYSFLLLSFKTFYSRVKIKKCWSASVVVRSTAIGQRGYFYWFDWWVKIFTLGITNSQSFTQKLCQSPGISYFWVKLFTSRVKKVDYYLRVIIFYSELVFLGLWHNFFLLWVSYSRTLTPA